jgi:hypothetical protein
MGKKKDIKAAQKKLNYSEESRGHARARHAHPTLPAGPSIDAYLKGRMPANAANGTKMSAFYKGEDQDRCVEFAYGQVDSHTVAGTRTTMRVKTGGTLNSITVRVVERIDAKDEGYDAKLREVLVVVDDLGKPDEVIITAYPSDSYRA